MFAAYQRTKTVTGRSDRSIVTPLLVTCTLVLGMVLFVVALSASLLSLRLGYGELERRGLSAAAAISHLLRHADITAARDAPLMIPGNLDTDPDVLAAIVADEAGRTLFMFQKPADALAKEAAARILDHGPAGWERQFVLVATDFAHAAGRNLRFVVAYDTQNAWHRALSQFALCSIGAFVALSTAILALKIVFARLMKPMWQLAHVTTKLADEQYRTEVPGLGRDDEIGTMARAIDAFKTRLLDRQRMRDSAIAETHRSIARHALIDERVDVFRSSIGRSLREVGDLSDQMQVAADSLASIAKQTTVRAGSAVSAIRETSVNVSTVAGASEDLSSSIREIERQVEQTRELVGAASRSTAETGSVINGLFEKSEKIDEIIELIQAIAAQTNLLSLNAAIEAARAGASGRGFAVVAQEVKSLADQTARASQSVSDHVRSIQAATSQAVEAISSIDATMAKAEQYSTVIAEAVERQAVATASISRSAADAAKTAGEAADTMRRLAAAVGETDQSAAQVHQSATDVGLQAHDLSTTIDAFLTDTATLRETVPDLATPRGKAS